MAENPATWGDLEHAIADALDDFEAGALDPDFYGASQVSVIAHALREGGFINERNDSKAAKLHTAEESSDTEALSGQSRAGSYAPLSSVRTN